MIFAELQKVNILVSRILNISKRIAGHFLVVSANLILHKKALTPLIYGTIQLQIHKLKNKIGICSMSFVMLWPNSEKNIFRTCFSWKSGYRTKKVFLQLCWRLTRSSALEIRHIWNRSETYGSTWRPSSSTPKITSLPNFRDKLTKLWSPELFLSYSKKNRVSFKCQFRMFVSRL